ncbi:MAG: hypothetical protein ACI9SJ_000063 [Flavobacteriaceae bacterium]|jgi:uncharacterized protein (DUF1684 family)|uniref:DUF1684 domain-containing protein n=1 Tax=Candidatus Marifrigoribacter sp. Uisw_064 TaxID=3230970 RepID=UPI003ADB4D49
MQFKVLFLLILVASQVFSQDDGGVLKAVKKYQTEANEKFSNSETTILDSLDLISFKSLEFYPVDLKFNVKADFVRTPDENPFLMKTSTSRLPEYVKYGEAHFSIDDELLTLNLYKSTSEAESPEDEYLFLPFTDLTSGDGSYGGGRYVELDIPTSETIYINFNLAYNPYCAYSNRYSCPIPPKENDLLVRVEAGVKDYGHH